MYESPINIIIQDTERQVVQQMEQTILEVIRKYGVDVNKDELIKALNYDRAQYNKGYVDGCNDVLDKIRADIDQLPTRIRTNWNYAPFDAQIEYVDVTKDQLLEIIRSKYLILNPVYDEMMMEGSDKDNTEI